ncbi:MAG: type II toxin-antitoxin system VapC family toxin [Gammaproteobacteria bacterium]
MRVLLDTHLLLWALGSPLKLSAETRKLVDTSEVFVSAASIWEISIKSAIGKLKADPQKILAAIEPTGLSILAITGEHAARVARLPSLHKDPFDRLLVAQALSEPMILLTNDQALAGYGELVQVV